MYQKNQIATIQIGPKSTQLGAAYFYLESQQIFDENTDNIDHSILFSDLNITTPRTLIYSFKGQIEALNYIAQSKIKEEKKKVQRQDKNFDPLNPIQSMLWDQQIQKLQQKEIKENEEEEHDELWFETEKQKLLKTDNPYFDYVQNTLPKTKYMHELYRTNDNDFNAYTSGKQEFMSKSEERDDIEDKLRMMLEENDYLQGFQIFSDCDSGFGSFSSQFIDILEDECPKKPRFFLALTDKKGVLEKAQGKVYQESVQAMNDLLVMTEIQKKVSMLVPLDISYTDKLGHIFNQESLKKSQFNQYSALATIVSNITLPWRIKDNQGFKEIMNEITPYQEFNIFNGIANIPIIKLDEHMLDENEHILQYRDNIFRHKSFQNSMLLNKNIPCYGESFVLRGNVKMPKDTKFENKLDMKIIDQIFATPDRFPPIFSEKIMEFYQPEEFEDDLTEEQKQELRNQITNLQAFPLHTVLFCHESFKYNVKNTINLFKTGDIKSILRFQEDDFSRDEIYEVLNQSEQLYDDYCHNLDLDEDDSEDENNY